MQRNLTFFRNQAPQNGTTPDGFDFLSLFTRPERLVGTIGIVLLLLCLYMSYRNNRAAENAAKRQRRSERNGNVEAPPAPDAAQSTMSRPLLSPSSRV